MTTPLPCQTAIFASGVLLSDAASRSERPRPGVRRLLDGLAARGVTLLAVAEDSVAGLAQRLGRAGLGHVEAVHRSEAPSGTGNRPVACIVQGDRPAPSWAGVAPGVVRVESSEPLTAALHRWLAARVGPFAASGALTAPLDAEACGEAERRQRSLTKPPGSLGRLETIGIRLAGIAGECPPPLPRPAAVAVFAGDHGVHAQGVSPWPQEVTAQMVANIAAGGAAISVLARQIGARIVVVDVGVVTDLPDAPGQLIRKVRPGTADLSTVAAMTVEEARRALDVGAGVAGDLVEGGARCLVTGDMGIANTTPSAALIAALTDNAAAVVTGRGTGIDDDALARKTGIVERAAARARAAHGHDALAILAEVGGLEHAALAGFVTAAVARQVPVIVDGVIAAASLLVACRLVPGMECGVLAGHRSVEPGASAVFDTLGLEPIVDLGLGLGEGTGATLALPLVEAAARILGEMATFDQAGITGKDG